MSVMRTHVKDWLRRGIGGMLLPKTNPIVIASTGRSGSTMLFNSVVRSLVKARANLDPSSAIGSTVCRAVSGFVDRLPDVGSRPLVVCKTHDLFESPPAVPCRYVFVYADPLDSAMSVERMVQAEGLSWFDEHQHHLRAQGAYADLFRKDVLNYERQVRSWLSQKRPDVYCVDFDDLWAEREALSDFLGFDLELEPKRARTSKPEPTDADTELFDRLREVKRDLTEQRREAASALRQPE